jgi:hypothetical protein
MTPPNKPEWMELADADGAPQVKKVTRALPALVLAAALTIVGVGALVAQGGEQTPATAKNQVIELSATSAPTQPSAITESKSNSVANPGAVAKQITPKQPGIAAMPTGGDDDDDDEREGHKDRGDRGDHDDDDDDDEGEDD